MMQVVSSGKQKAILCLKQAAVIRYEEGHDGNVTSWADGSVCVSLINTTMKVGCAEASGTLEQSLLATDHRYAPIHTTSIIQCLMYLEKYLNELAEL